MMGSNFKKQADVLEKLKSKGLKNPLEFMLEVLNDRQMTVGIRLEAAGKAAPYVHKKQPLALQHAGEVKIIPPYVPPRNDIMSADEAFMDEYGLDDL
jgi:hypothetical protein